MNLYSKPIAANQEKQRLVNMSALNKDAISRIFGQSGQVRGVVLCTDAKYVRRHHNERSVRLVEEMTEELGYPIDYDGIKMMSWYPAVLRGVSLLAIVEALGYKDKELKLMGWAAPRNSIITKLMLRYFANLDMLVKKLPVYWRKNYTLGSLTGNLGDHSLCLCLKGIRIPEQFLPYLEGYFTSVISMVIGNDDKIRMDNIGHIDGDDKCYELVINWQNNSRV